MARHLLSMFARLPVLMRVGLVVLAAGGALDLGYHAAPLAWHMFLDGYLGRQAFLAHLVTLIGMITTLLGVLISRSPLAQGAHTEQ